MPAWSAAAAAAMSAPYLLRTFLFMFAMICVDSRNPLIISSFHWLMRTRSCRTGRRDDQFRFYPHSPCACRRLSAGIALEAFHFHIRIKIYDREIFDYECRRRTGDVMATFVSFFMCRTMQFSVLLSFWKSGITSCMSVIGISCKIEHKPRWFSWFNYRNVIVFKGNVQTEC